MIRLLISLSIYLTISFTAFAQDPIGKIFSDAGAEGTIVISSLKGQKNWTYNPERAATRLSPASSFKILNTLISLEVGAIKNKDEIIKWNGQHYDLPDWNRDQTLQSAFKVSCVWCYQDLARRVKEPSYRYYLDLLPYGKLPPQFELTTFWLDGSLTISAIEQVEFLKGVYQRQYPFSAKSYATLKEIMLSEQKENYKIYSKTGWAVRVNPSVGWYVGYVETPQDVWIFATNMVIRSDADLPLREELTKKSLKILGIIP